MSTFRRVSSRQARSARSSSWKGPCSSSVPASSTVKEVSVKTPPQTTQILRSVIVASSFHAAVVRPSAGHNAILAAAVPRHPDPAPERPWRTRDAARNLRVRHHPLVAGGLSEACLARYGCPMDQPSPDQGALGRLVAGFGRFRQQHFEEDRDLYESLREAQRPEVMVIACSDSRSDPALIYGARPGDLFVIRNVAALVPPHDADGRPHGTASAIEFGVRALGVRHVVVLGHSYCAGVRCLMDHDHAAHRYDYVSDWVAVARSVREEMDALVTEADPALLAMRAEQATVLASLRNLSGYPWIAARVADGTLALHGWYFHFGLGALQAAAGPCGPFLPLDPGHPPAPAIGALPRAG